MTDLDKAAEGKDGTLAHATREKGQREADKAARKAAKEAERERRRTEREAAEAVAAAAAQPDPIAAAQAILARGEEIDASYRDFHDERDIAFQREQRCLKILRQIYGHHRHRLNDTRWCATEAGRQVLDAVNKLRGEVDRLSGIKPEDPDYELLWQARVSEFHEDFVACVLEAAQPIVSGHGNADPILVEISPQQEAKLLASEKHRRVKRKNEKQKSTLKRFFFKVRTEGERKTFYPKGYKDRPEVQRVVRELQQLQKRALEGFDRERERSEELLQQHGLVRPNADTGESLTIDLAALLNLSEPSPYEGAVDIALWIGGFSFVPPGEMRTRHYGGCIHLKVENTTDTETNGPAKLITMCEAVGHIERTLPAAGVQWLIPLGQFGRKPGELGLERGWNDVVHDRQPVALLRHIQQMLFMASKREWTIDRAFGLEAFHFSEELRRGKHKARRGGNGVPEGAQAAPAPDAAAPATPTDETPAS